jgi:hypothetical protein
LDALMNEAASLAQELSAQVGTSSSQTGAAGQAASAGAPLASDPEASVEQVQKNLVQAASEIGTEPPGTKPSAQVPPQDGSSEATLADLDPSEWQTDDGNIPTIEGGNETEAESPSDGASKATEESPDPAGKAGSLRTSLGRRLVKLWARPRLTQLATLSPTNLVRFGRRVLSSTGAQPPAAFRFALAAINRPFRWVPLEARSIIGYLAILTLVSALVTFAIGRFR